MHICDVLSLRAGPAAMAYIRENGFGRDDVGALAGAAGGPKWLILSALDRFLFGDWLADVGRPLELVGSSIGAWRFAAACHRRNPVNAINELQRGYLAQRYSDDAGRDEITTGLDRILGRFFDDDVRDGVLTHPYYRLNVITVRSRFVTATERRLPLAVGSAVTWLGNALCRPGLGLGFERVVFAHPQAQVHWARRRPRTVALTAANARDAVFASGSVPMLMHGQRNIPGAPAGIYRDGGIADYHIDQPILDAATDRGPLVLMPHFGERLVPGWFDKALLWRRPRYAEHTLMVAPAAKLVSELPSGVPNRKDFYHYKGDDAGRLRAWQAAMDAGKRMRDAFAAFVDSDTPAQFVKPL